MTFLDLHRPGTPFVLANAWDAGSARLLATLGFPALGTTSGGLAATLGRRDAAGLLSRDEALANAAAIVGAVDLPVSADLEGGYGETPDDVADTVRAAAGVGLAGVSIEDATGDPARPLLPVDRAAERVAAAVSAADGSGVVVTARAENFLQKGTPDLDDVLARLRAYADAGAHVLYAPALPDADAVRAVVALGRPVNVLIGAPRPGLTIAALAELGVARVSLGGALTRVAFGAVERAAVEVRDHGTLGFLGDGLPGARFAEILG